MIQEVITKRHLQLHAIREGMMAVKSRAGKTVIDVSRQLDSDTLVPSLFPKLEGVC